MQVRYEKIEIFNQCFALSEMIQDRAIVAMVWNANGNLYAVCRMMPFPMTLNDC